ncbi:MAG: hypothetical protein K6G11_04705 [Lachnospiraceae bacterium]|nr:hypothetical protein [Lachnospiraceae bacterium]
MIISFWSPVKKTGCVTANMILLSSLCAIKPFGGRALLLENHYNKNNIGQYTVFQEYLDKVCENSAAINNYGMDGVLRKLTRGDTNQDSLLSPAIDLSIPNMYYFPHSYLINKEVYEYQFYYAMNTFFNAFNDGRNVIYVDVESNNNISTFELLNNSDCIVVNLNQSENDLTYFFENYGSLTRKAIFLISKYQPELALNISKIKRLYPFKNAPIFTIPYNVEFEYAMEIGRAQQFIFKNHFQPSESNKYFIRETSKTADYLRGKIIKNLTDRMFSD